jgi:hypothetical protein
MNVTHNRDLFLAWQKTRYLEKVFALQLSQRAMGKFQHSTRIEIFQKRFHYLVCEENSGSSGAGLSALFKLLQAVFFILAGLTQVVFKWKMKRKLKKKLKTN